ncbi:hypothetical protein Golob_021406 [Gossypium lobatum]|uniref:Uncharacterized protein n=1 Tax=Gossypium lobatum TaxID=34289 RepID=A0A7J8LDG4_9ROSI|nr:hypothetical protein [Gossypium lobatum]
MRLSQQNRHSQSRLKSVVLLRLKGSLTLMCLLTALQAIFFLHCRSQEPPLPQETRWLF